MKILFIVPNLNKKGGVANYYRIMKTYLSNDIRYYYRSKIEGKFKFLNIIIDSIHINRSIKKDIGSVVINHSFSIPSFIRDCFFILLIRFKNKPFIVFFHGWNNWLESKIDANRFFHFLLRITILKANKIIVLASSFRKALKRWGYQGEVILETVATKDIPVNYYLICRKTDKIIKVIFISNIIEEKGIFIALDAVKRLQYHYDISLFVCGDGIDLERVKKYVFLHDIRSIEFLGYIKGKRRQEIFRKSDIHLLPTYCSEGMPTVVLEAMAFGLPVITRSVGGVLDFFEDGKMGFITESKTPKVFAELIEKLIKNPVLRRTISEYNYQYAKEHFFVSKVAKRIGGIWR
ncbi:MAG: glycosyltransferase family 4 protein [Candidatus Omnitrophica bacterium]|nr:glycosyltransferase family 4 protein [Candidatus Omnitrophota bacterium]